MRRDQWFDRTIRIGVGALFVSSGILKLIGFRSFTDSVSSFEMLPAAVVPMFSSVVVGAEIFCGVALIFGVRRRTVTNILSLMMILFTAVVVKGLLSHTGSSCGCFGELSSEKIDLWMIARNLLLLFLLYRLNRTKSAAIDGGRIPS